MSSFSRGVRGLFGGLTTRGRWFTAVGGAAAVCGLIIPQPDLVRVGALLVVLALVSALTLLRSGGRLSCVCGPDRPRVAAGKPVTVTARVDNASRLRTGVLLAEAITPDTLGAGSQLVLDGIGPNGHWEMSYRIRPQVRGRFSAGLLRMRMADAFGLVEIGRSFSTTSTLVVTPQIFPLPRPTTARSWLGEGDGAVQTISAIGEDDAAPQSYQDGDGLHRVHWKSTARHGELMVCREEHQWRNSGSVFLDTRRSSHAGSGPASTFEFAVSAAASIGVHPSGEGFRARLITNAGEIAPRGTFEDTLLDMLAVSTPSRTAGLRTGTSALASTGGQLTAVAGRMSADDAPSRRAISAGDRGGEEHPRVRADPGPGDLQGDGDFHRAAARGDGAGQLGGGRAKLRGTIDVITLQTPSRRGDIAALTARYGLIAADECHHVPAAAFEGAVRQIPARRWLGLTATPYRRDKLDDLIGMQVGPVRYTIATPRQAPGGMHICPAAPPAGGRRQCSTCTGPPTATTGPPAPPREAGRASSTRT
jgi:uncharacterized protein (DUF58 family)